MMLKHEIHKTITSKGQEESLCDCSFGEITGEVAKSWMRQTFSSCLYHTMIINSLQCTHFHLSTLNIIHTIVSGVQLLQNLQLLVCLVLALCFMHEGVSDVLVDLLAYCVQLPTQYTYLHLCVRYHHFSNHIILFDEDLRNSI